MTDRSKHQRQEALIIAALLGAMLWVSSAYGTTWYVRKTGSNTNSGTSASDAYLTISKAASMVYAGDTVYVGAGTYAEQVNAIRGGTVGAYISFIADTTGTHTEDAGDVIVTGSHSRDQGFEVEYRSYIRIQGFHVIATTKEGLRFKNCNGIIVQSCHVHDNDDDGMEFEYCPASQILDCHVYANNDQGIEIDKAGGAPYTVSRCVIYQNRNEGIKAKAWVTTPSLYVNCLIYGNGKHGIKLEHSLTTATVYNNTIVGNGERGIEIRDATVTVKNNIIAFNTREGIKNSGNVTNDYNLFWQNTLGLVGLTAGPNAVSADPRLMDRAANDYHLTANSPAVNAGTTSGAPTVDYENSTRKSADGYVDVGADEYGITIRVISWREVRR